MNSVRLYILTVLIILTSCDKWKKEQTEIDKEKSTQTYFDSLSTELFLKSNLLTATSNIDSIDIKFYEKDDFNFILDFRNLTETINDSIGIRFKSQGPTIKEMGELFYNDYITGYDTLFTGILEGLYYEKGKTTEASQDLTKQLGLNPSTVIDYLHKTEKYYGIIKKKNIFSPDHNFMIITIYASELTEVPYPKTLYRLFVNDKHEIVDSGVHYDYDIEFNWNYEPFENNS